MQDSHLGAHAATAAEILHRASCGVLSPFSPSKIFGNHQDENENDFPRQNSQTRAKAAVVLLSLAVGMTPALGQSFQTNLFTGLNVSIPNGNLSGTQDIRTVSSGIAEVTSVRVRLKIAGQFNGDLYGYVRYRAGSVTNTSVLLNRPGRMTNQVTDFGYNDSGLDVTFDDGAANDIHTYQTVTNPPATVSLFGTWQPDARFVDPLQSTNGSARTAFLNVFRGMNANGEWTLFVADVDGHSNSTNALNSWGLELSGKTVPAITWSNPVAIPYGTALGAAQLNASANVPGTFTYNPTAGTILSAGNNQTLSATFNPADTNAYVSKTTNVTISVSAVSLTVRANALSRTYGATNPVLTASYSGFVNGETTNVLSGAPILTTPAQTNSPVGNYLVQIAQGSLASTNYSFSFSNAFLTITQAALGIRANDAVRVYGQTNPTFSVTYSGFVNGENTNVLTGSPALSTTAQTNSPVGAYPIQVVAGSLTNTNYAFLFTNGTLTITRAGSAASLISSANPARVGSNVTFAVSVSAAAPSSGTPSGNVQFKVDGLAYGSPVTLTNGQASRSTTTLGPGSHTVDVEYPGDSNFLGTTAALSPSQFIASVPVASADIMPRVLNHLTRMPVSNFLVNDSDADGDPVVFDSVAATSSAGGTVSRTNDWIFYIPPGGYASNDFFNYVVRDTHGLYATGLVSVVVLTDREIAARLTILDLESGTFQVTSTGVPWGAYRIESTENPLAPSWTTLALGSADAWGDLTVVDAPTPGTQARFYRSIYQGDGNLTLPFRIVMSSSANPAPAHALVTFTITFTPFSQGSIPPSGTVQFKVDGVVHGNPVNVISNSASLGTTNLTLGEHIIIAEYSGDTNYGEAISALARPQVINTPPIAVGDVIYRDPIRGTKMLESDLMANDAEVDGDAMVFEGVDTTTAEGGSLSIVEGWIFYTPPAGFVGADSFTYTLRDSRGGTATATNQIIPRVGTAPSANLTVVDMGGGAYRIAFSGIPWRNYTIQYVTGPGQTNWLSLASVTADSHGGFVYQDVLSLESPSRYYRTISPAAAATASPFRMAVWTNFIAHTNGRTMEMWTTRAHPPGWPTTPPAQAWATNSLIYGLEGFTGISQCSEFEVSPGQIPVTLLTRRHGYTRGHGMGENGVRTNLNGMKVWFCTSSNTIVQMTVAASLIRVDSIGGNNYDHGLVVFTADVPPSVSPVYAISPVDMEVLYFNTPDLPYMFLGTEQSGHVSANVAPFVYDILKGGDSGSPNLLPSPDNKLIMFSGRGTSGLSSQIQADIDTLSAHEGLNTNNYQLRWYDLSAWAP